MKSMILILVSNTTFMIFCCCFYDNFQKYPCIEELAGESFQTTSPLLLPTTSIHYLNTVPQHTAPQHSTSHSTSTLHFNTLPQHSTLTQYLNVVPHTAPQHSTSHCTSTQYLTQHLSSTVAHRAPQTVLTAVAHIAPHTVLHTETHRALKYLAHRATHHTPHSPVIPVASQCMC